MMKMKQTGWFDDVTDLVNKGLYKEENDIMEEAHYWMLVDNVARWMFEHKDTTILSDIESKVLQLYREGVSL